MADPNQPDDQGEFASTLAIDTREVDFSNPMNPAATTPAVEEATMPMSAGAAEAFLADMEAAKAAKQPGAFDPAATVPENLDMGFASTIAADNDLVDQAKALLASQESENVSRATVVESRENIEAVLAQASTMVERELPVPHAPLDRGTGRPIAPTLAEKAVSGPPPSHMSTVEESFPQAATAAAQLQTPTQEGLPPATTGGTSRGLIIAIAIVGILLLGAIAFVVTVALT